MGRTTSPAVEHTDAAQIAALARSARRRPRARPPRSARSARRLRAPRARDGRPRALPRRRRRPRAARPRAGRSRARGRRRSSRSSVRPSRSRATRPSFPLRCSRRRRFGSPSQLGDEEAFLLLPLYPVFAAAVLALAYRVARGERPQPPPVPARAAARGSRHIRRDVVPLDVGRAGGRDRARVLRLPVRRRAGAVARSPARVVASAGARSSRSSRSDHSSPRSASGRRRRARSSSRATWRSRTRTRRSSASRRSSRTRACTAATSSSRSPCCSSRSSSGAVGRSTGSWPRRSWCSSSGACFYSYSQSSFVALFVVTFAVALVGSAAEAAARLLALRSSSPRSRPAQCAAQAVGGRSAKDVTSGRSRLVTVTLDAFTERPVAGVGIGGQPRASSELVGKGSPSRNASHTTPLTVLAELGFDRLRPLRLAPRGDGWALAARRTTRPRARPSASRPCSRRSSCTRCSTRASSRIR